ncbi:TIGR03943 family putative permease subunit [Psychrobacillus sp. FSL K6-1415]|uniref:TIGR03943 family putative permease subunit n=1 Tax=Psychrobacillus sp. FSL K6-1415 TaxID=2921544 RepID=UPI0030FCE9FE
MQKERDYSFHILLRGIILIGFFLLTFKLALTGDIEYYIAPKMIPFSYFAIGVLLILAVIQIWRSGSKNKMDLFCNCGFDHNNSSFLQSGFIYSLFFLPILIGFWFPDTIMDSSIVANRGINYGLNSSLQQTEFGGDSSALSDNSDISYFDEGSTVYNNRLELKNELLNNPKIIVKDEFYLDTLDIFVNDLNSFIGKEIEIMGFVYKEPDLKPDQFVISRVAIACCVADSSVFGTIATTDISHPVVMDEWIKATGILAKTNVDGQYLPNLQINKIERIEQPEDPYVYIPY